MGGHIELDGDFDRFFIVTHNKSLLSIIIACLSFDFDLEELAVWQTIVVLNFICLLLFWVLFIASNFWHHDFLVFNIAEEPFSVVVKGVRHASDCANHGLACLA